jgi:hypothetical protein
LNCATSTRIASIFSAELSLTYRAHRAILTPTAPVNCFERRFEAQQQVRSNSGKKTEKKPSEKDRAKKEKEPAER